MPQRNGAQSTAHRAQTLMPDNLGFRRTVCCLAWSVIDRLCTCESAPMMSHVMGLRCDGVEIFVMNCALKET